MDRHLLEQKEVQFSQNKMYPQGYKEQMPMHDNAKRLELSEDEAFALLGLAMTAEMELDADAEKAVAKLAQYCREQQSFDHSGLNKAAVELCETG